MKNGSGLITRACTCCSLAEANAASISRSELALKTKNGRPVLLAAALPLSISTSAVGDSGLTTIAAFRIPGSRSYSRFKRFGTNSLAIIVKPVMFPPGLLKVVTSPSANLKILAVGENRWQLGGMHQINNKLPVVCVFCLFTDDDPVDVFLRHCPQHAAIFFGLDRAFERRAQKRDTQLLGSLPHRISRRLAPYLTRSEEPHLRCRRDNFAQDLQTLAPDVEPCVHTDPGDVSSRPRDIGHNAIRNGISHGGNDGDRVCRGFETQNES